MNKWKTPYLVVITIITVAAIVWGVFFRIIGTSYRFFGEWNRALGKNVSETIDIADEDYTSILVDMSIGDIKIEYGDSTSIKYEYPKNLVPKVDVVNGTLTITQKEDVKYPINGFSGKRYDLDIVIPRGTDIDIIELDVDLGDVKLSGVECNQLLADLSLGNFECKGVKSEKVDAELAMGNAVFKDAEFKAGDFDCDMGNMEVYGSFDKLTAYCSMGNITIVSDKPVDEVDIDVDCSMGSATVNGKAWF